MKECEEVILEALASESGASASLTDLVSEPLVLENVVDRVMSQYPDWRRGQTYFNVLSTASPELARELAGTDVDPFYVDARLPDFRRWLTTRSTDA